MNNGQCRTDNLSAKKVMFSVLSVIIFLLSCINTITVYADDPSIWKYDFRSTFYDIDFTGNQRAVIVGSMGQILVTHDKYNNLWSPRSSGTKELLTAVCFIDERYGWALGNGGIIINTTDGGDTWKIQRKSSAQNQPLFDIQFLSRDTGYACGAFDTFLKTTDCGKTWKSIPTHITNKYSGLDTLTYNSLFFIDKDTGYLVGEYRTILRTKNGGRSWENLYRGGEGSLFGIILLNPSTIITFGISGKILRSADEGRNWTEIPSGCKNNLFRAAFDSRKVIIAGASGVMLTSENMGKSFKIEYDNNDQITSAGICLRPAGGFIIVGERGKINYIKQAQHTVRAER